MTKTLDDRTRWWARAVLVAVFIAASAVVAFAADQPLVGLALLLLAGQSIATRYMQLWAFRDGWHTATAVPRSTRRPLEPWDPIPPPIYPDAPEQGSRWSVMDDGS